MKEISALGFQQEIPRWQERPILHQLSRTRIPKKSFVAPLVMLSRPYVSRNCGEFQWCTRRTFFHVSQLDLTDRRECIFRHLDRSSFQQKHRIVELHFVISENSSVIFSYWRKIYVRANISLINSSLKCFPLMGKKIPRECARVYSSLLTRFNSTRNKGIWVYNFNWSTERNQRSR